MNIFEQLRAARDSLREKGDWCEVFYVEGPDLEGSTKTWAVEVRSNDANETLMQVCRGMRRIREVREPVAP
jgi:hypothetical protein